MGSLHSVTENIKKILFFGVIGIIILMVLWTIISIILQSINKPKVTPADMGFGPVPPIPFPSSTITQPLTYELDTVDGHASVTDALTGQLIPVGDRMLVYQMLLPIPDLNSLQEASNKVLAVGISNLDGSAIHPERISETVYRWSETQGGYAKSIDMDISNFNFQLNSVYTVYPAVLAANHLPTDIDAVTDVKDFLNKLQLYPTDIDDTQTTTADFTIVNNSLVPTVPGNPIHAIKVSYYQKAINGIPIVYPNPPDSIMNLLVTGGDQNAEIGQGMFYHQSVNLAAQGSSTYPLKSPDAAYLDLQKGKAYITPGFSGGTNQVNIKTITLGYYIGQTPQTYLMPVYVFTGDNNFKAYVSAIDDSAISNPTPTP